MTNYSQYDVEDFAANRSFQTWVFQTNDAACAFWDDWIRRNPEKSAAVEEARSIVSGLRFKEMHPSMSDMEEVRNNITRALKDTRPASGPYKLGSLHRMTAVAASLVLCLAGSWWYFHPAPPLAGAVILASGSHSPAPDAGDRSAWRTYENRAGNAMRIRLNDSSVVTVFANTIIRYPDPFAGNKREILLDGDAIFQVAKDKSRPFTVFSGTLSVTALGTSFRITSPDRTRQNIVVKLFTGKVRVRSIQNTDHWGRDVFLLPGEQFRYDGSHSWVSRFRPAPGNPMDKAGMDESNGEIRFKNTPLLAVMKALSAFYDIRINYSQPDIAKMNFTGSVNQKDDAKAVLQAIAQMNGLQIIQTPEGFSVTRRPE